MYSILQYLTHEFLPVFVPRGSNFIGWGHLPFATPGIQKVFNITHDAVLSSDLRKQKLVKIRISYKSKLWKLPSWK